jgi:hypothetical protein
MRALLIALGVAGLAACSSAASPSLPAANGATGLPARISRATPKNGIYVAQFGSSSVYGYAGANQQNAPPICGEPSGDFTADVATDPKGGPKLCGPSVAQLQDPYGLPVDVASADAVSGTIAVANIEDDGPISDPPPGSITLCTVAAGCTVNLTNAQMYRVAGVAFDKSGDCWASAMDGSGGANLTYFKHCAGSGKAATGYKNTSYGGLQLDKQGDLIALDWAGKSIFIYSGCKPACTLVAGPLALRGQSLYGKVDAHGTTFAVANYTSGEIDVYSFNGKALSYQYSFDQDLNKGSDVEGVAFSPGLSGVNEGRRPQPQRPPARARRAGRREARRRAVVRTRARRPL